MARDTVGKAWKHSSCIAIILSLYFALTACVDQARLNESTVADFTNPGISLDNAANASKMTLELSNTTLDNTATNPTPKYNIFDDLVTSGLYGLRMKYPNAKPYSIQGEPPTNKPNSSTNAGDFRVIEIRAWDYWNHLEIKVHNSRVDFRIFGEPKTYDPGPGVIQRTTFEWKNRRMTLAECFGVLRRRGKLRLIVQVELQSSRRPGMSQDALGAQQPYYVVHFEDESNPDIWVGAWDRQLYPRLGDERR